LVTRVGKLKLRVPQNRNGRFSTEIFERYQRNSEKALVAALTQMYIQGVSTRKVKAISEELCGHSFSASASSEINKKLDAELGRFARRELESEYPYLIIDARYEKLRENGVIRSRAVKKYHAVDFCLPRAPVKLVLGRTSRTASAAPAPGSWNARHDRQILPPSPLQPLR
jgi:transposase-like protein